MIPLKLFMALLLLSRKKEECFSATDSDLGRVLVAKYDRRPPTHCVQNEIELFQKEKTVGSDCVIVIPL